MKEQQDERYSELSLSLLSTIVGREQEIQQGLQCLQDPDVRLLTLTGPGGVGKTRLAQAIAESANTFFSDGVLVISLASLNHPDLLVPTLLQELGVREEQEQPLFTTLIAFLREKQCLIFLDNFEQIVKATPILVDLLSQCSRLKILVTSREVLRVRCEHILHVQPLPAPDFSLSSSTTKVSENATIQLFVQRVQAIQPTLAMTEENIRIIAEICIRLEGIPLALELAAVRCRLLSFQELLERLDHPLRILNYGLRDLPSRQQTLRNTLAWSYELLTDEERQLFRALAIFVGGCTIEAVEVVCDVPIDVPNVLTSLLEKNLLQRVEPFSNKSRLRMLETIREYGLECLQTSGEYQQLQRRHANFYLLLTEQAEQHFTGPVAAEWLARLEQEYDNIRSALSYYVEHEEMENALRMCGALRYFWMLNGHRPEGYRWITTILARVEKTITQSGAKALLAASILAPYHNEHTQRLERCQESLTLFQTLEDKEGIAETLHEMGNIARRRGKLTTSRELYTRSLTLFQEMDKQQGIADTKLSLATVLHAQMENHEARQLGLESLQIFKTIGNHRGSARALNLLAFIAGYYQEHRNALMLAEESLRIFQTLGDQWEIATQLHHVAELALRQNEAEHAQVCVEESLRISQQVGNREAMARAQHLRVHVLYKRQQFTTIRPLLEQCLTLYEEIDNQEGVALVLIQMGQDALQSKHYQQAHTLLVRSFQILVQKENKAALIENLRALAHLAAAEKCLAWAVRLLGAADTLREAIGRQPLALKNAYRLLTTMGATPPNERIFTALWREGRMMTPEKAFVAQGNEIDSQQEIKHDSDPTNLTTREREVLRLITQGLTNRQIAKRLVVSPVTINAHVRSIYNKLDVTSRSAATRYALHNHLV